MFRSLAFVLAVASATLATTPALAKPATLKKLGQKEWPGVRGMAALDGKLYVAAGTTVYASDKSGKFTDVFGGKSPNWGNAELLTVLDGKVYALFGGTLYDIDKNGKHTSLGDGYRKPGGMVGLDGKLYVASDDALYEVDKAGKYQRLGKGDWYNVHGVTALDGKLYIVSNQTLYEVDRSGKETKLEGQWNNVVGLSAANGKLYIFTSEEKGQLHEVDKTGKGTVILADGAEGNAINALTAWDGTLYMTVPKLAESALYSVDVK